MLASISHAIFIFFFISESLRKHPPAATLLRIATKDYYVPNIDLKIPRMQMVLIPVYAIHHDDQYFNEPEEFIPERFDPEEVQKRPSCSFLPFGDGMRNIVCTL